MKRVQGIGGVFFKSKDHKKLQQWYSDHLGIGPRNDSPWGEDDPASLLEWRDKDNPDRKCFTVFAPFPDDSDYFDTPYMLNLRVDDLDAVLAELKKEGIELHGEILTYEFGRFARIIDPEGNPIELWEPAEGF